MPSNAPQPAGLPTGGATHAFEEVAPGGPPYLIITDAGFLAAYLAHAVPLHPEQSPQLFNANDHYVLVDPAARTAIQERLPAEIRLATLQAMDGVHCRTTSLPDTHPGYVIGTDGVTFPLAVEAAAPTGTPLAGSTEDLRATADSAYRAGDPIEPAAPPAQEIAAKASRLVFDGFEDTLLLALRLRRHLPADYRTFSRFHLFVGVAAFCSNVEFRDLVEFVEAIDLGSQSSLIDARETLAELDAVATKKVHRGNGRPRYQLQPGAAIADYNGIQPALTTLNDLLAADEA